MAYTPIGWQTGDTITAEKLNKMDNGWSIDSTQLFSETVTTNYDGEFNASDLVYVATSEPPDTLNISFDGVDYSCTRNGENGEYYYGAEYADLFTNYPFKLELFVGDSSHLYTETAGTYTISGAGEVVEISSNFNNAVNKCVDMTTVPMLCVDGTTTMADMMAALVGGRFMYFSAKGSMHFINAVNEEVSNNAVTFYPTSEDFTAGFNEDEIFTIYWSWG